MTIHDDQMPAQVHTKCWPVNQVDRLPAKLSSAVCHSQHVTTIVQPELKFTILVLIIRGTAADQTADQDE